MGLAGEKLRFISVRCLSPDELQDILYEHESKEMEGRSNEH